MKPKIYLSRELLEFLIKELDRCECDIFEYEEEEFLKEMRAANAKEGLGLDQVLQ